MTYYKALSVDGRSCNGGTSKWSLPTLRPDGTYKPGRWMPAVKAIEPCLRGYHLFERKDIFRWIGATLYEAEGRGAVINHGDKIVYESARLLRPLPSCNERTLRLFACRCAEDVLPFFEAQYPGDDRPRKAIDTARLFAEGDSTGPELAAAGDAAWGAEWDAGDAGDAWGAARAAARAAARTGDAAWDAAWGAAWDAARAGDAAWDAAWDAARAAAWNKYIGWLWEALDADPA